MNIFEGHYTLLEKLIFLVAIHSFKCEKLDYWFYHSASRIASFTVLRELTFREKCRVNCQNWLTPRLFCMRLNIRNKQ